MMRCTPPRLRAPRFDRARDGAALFALCHKTDPDNALTRRSKTSGDRLDIGLSNKHGHADTTIERPRHFLGLDMPLCLQERHQSRLFPCIGINMRVEACREHTRDIFE